MRNVNLDGCKGFDPLSRMLARLSDYGGETEDSLFFVSVSDDYGNMDYQLQKPATLYLHLENDNLLARIKNKEFTINKLIRILRRQGKKISPEVVILKDQEKTKEKFKQIMDRNLSILDWIGTAYYVGMAFCPPLILGTDKFIDYTDSTRGLYKTIAQKAGVES